MHSAPLNPGGMDWTRFCGPDWYGEQDEYGIDLSLIRENLRLSPLARVRRADAAHRQALALREAGRRHRRQVDGGAS